MANRIEPESHIDMRDDDQPDKKTDQHIDAPAPQDATEAEKSATPTTETATDTSTAAVVKTDSVADVDTDKTDDDSSSDDPAVVIHTGGRHRLRHWLGQHKKIIVPVTALVVILGVLAAVPMTRYAIAGMLVKQQFAITVVDSQTGKPVSSATVSLKGVQTKTDNQGKATLKVSVGTGTLSLEKHFYKTASQSVLVPLRKPVPLQVSFVATGRQVPVTVINKITGKPLANATLSAESSQAITDKNGEATLVLPADKKEAKGTVTANTYNSQAITVKITATKDNANTFQITPAGKMYFLSNASGNVDVVKTDLDGANRQTVLKGTGKEDKSNTILLASQNWKYLALLSKRDGGASAKLYLIDTSNDALSTMDEGDADFSLVGWSGTTFVYQVSRHNKQPWDNKASALKSYEAGAKKLSTLDETSASGTNFNDYFSENYSRAFILNNEVVFAKSVSAPYPSLINDHLGAFYSIKPDGSSKKTIKSWPADSGKTFVSITVSADDPNTVYVANNSSSTNPLYQYEDGQLKTIDGKKSDDIYLGDYTTYLFSPSNKQTLWSAQRDGKNTLFVGDDNAQGEKQLASLVDYQAFGWYTDDYVLLSLKDSELYVAPATAWGAQKPVKITDYFKPNFSAPGYGKGYGGF